MNVLTYNPDVMTKNTVIPLGRACECRATRIEFAVSSWLSRFPGGEIALYIKDPNGEMYLGDIRTENGVASWVLRESDTQVPGYGNLELALIGANGEKKLSAVATTKLEASLVESETDAEYMQPWIERAAEIQAETAADAKSAATYAAVASTAASNAVEAMDAADVAREAAEAAREAAEGAAQGVEESARAAEAAEDAAAGHAADAADSAQGADAAERAAQEAAQEAADSANVAAASAQEALTHAQAAQTVLSSIPSDYAALADQVARNRADILTKAPAIYEDASGALVAVEDAAALPASSVVSAITASQPGAGDPSPDNVRPISGFDAITLTRTGKNLLGFKDFATEGASFIDSYSNGVFRREVTTYHATSYALGTTAFKNIENPHIPAGTYTFTLKRISGVTYTNPYMEVTLSDGSMVNLASGVATTLPLDGTITSVRMTSKSFSKGDTIEYVMQLEAGAGTAYEPYNGVTLTTSLPETVYGGTLDWTTGLLTITHGADGAALAAPVTHQLDAQTVEMLKGHNAVWSDTGDTSVVYVADTKLYIDNAIAALAASILNA